MPVAPVDDKGTVLYYEDSGAPDETKDYLTIVLVHGLIFHGAIFRPLVPYAKEHRVRLVFVNMRDYPGSSEFSQDELEALGNADPDIQTAATRAIGHDIAFCLQHLITALDIPSVAERQGKRTGGLVLVGWSLGNFPSLAMLAGGHELPSETQDLLGRYLRTVVLYDAATMQVGADLPEGSYFPLRDPKLSLDECRDAFCDWVTYYFTTVDQLESVTEDMLAARKALHEEHGTDDPKQLPTKLRMTPDQYESVMYLPMFHRSYPRIRTLTKKTNGENFRRAVMDTEGLWPNVDILSIWCDMSISQSVWAAKYLLDQSRKEGDSSNARKINIIKFPGANHFGHWDDPGGFMKLLCSAL